MLTVPYFCAYGTALNTILGGILDLDIIVKDDNTVRYLKCKRALLNIARVRIISSKNIYNLGALCLVV
jgi:hypothetical protein